MHPGGTVLSLTAFGDVVVATTSERTLVGYSASGVRLWRVELDELVLTAPQRVSTGAIVATSVGGEVLTIDLATGRTGWRASIGSDVGARVSAGAGTVVVLSRNGDAVALRAADGHELWRVALTDPSHAAVLGDTVVVLDDNYVNGFDRRSGERRWRAVYPSLVGDVITLQGLVVVVGKEGTLAIDGSGRVRWRRQGYLDMVSDGTDLVGLTGDRADVLSRGGALRSSFAIPRYTAVSARHALVHPQGLWLFSGGWPFKDYSNGS
nr:PQQ-binding-like beta-propeller repeat protein [Microlunatus panaciterrae]